MCSLRRRPQNSLLGTRVSAAWKDGYFYSGEIEAVKSRPTGESTYTILFEEDYIAEVDKADIVGPGFQAVGSTALKNGQPVFISFKGREVAARVVNTSSEFNEVLVQILDQHDLIVAVNPEDIHLMRGVKFSGSMYERDTANSTISCPHDGCKENPHGIAFCHFPSVGIEVMSQGGVFAQSKEALDITLLGSEWSSLAGGVSTLNRELAIKLSQQPNVRRVSVLVPEGACKDEDKREARNFGINVLDAGKQPGFSEPLDWLGFPPQDHRTDVFVGHGVKLGRQVKVIKRSPQFQNCKWVHMVHTAPEELGKYKGYENPTSRGEQKHWDEVGLCKSADLVVPVGPKLEKAYSSYLQGCKKDEDIVEIVPGLFDREFGALEQKAKDESDDFIVLLCGRGDDEDFELKGYDIAVKAFADQRLKGKCYLLFVGAPDGKQDEVRRRLLDCGIKDEQLRVRKFVQSRAEMKDLFYEVDLVIMPSKSEGFGLVALEALSAGLPILVGSNTGFARALEEVEFGDTCIVRSNPAKWAKAIEGVRAKHKKRLCEMISIRESYKEMFCWQEQCGNLVEKLWKMVHENRPSEKPELTDAETTSESKNFEKENRPTEKPELTDAETTRESKNFEKENRPAENPELTDAVTTSESKNFENVEITDSHRGFLIRGSTAIALVAIAVAFLLYLVWSPLGDVNSVNCGYSNGNNMSLPLSMETTDPLVGFLIGAIIIAVISVIGNFVMAFLLYQARSHLSSVVCC